MPASRASRVQKQTHSPRTPPEPKAGVSSLYLFGPGLDLTLVAGGLTFALLPLCLAISPRFGQMGFLFLNFVCNYPHYMATNYRIYRSRAQIERYRFFAVHVTALFALTAILGHLLAGPWVAALFTLYFWWSPFHYTGQNYGISIMYLRRGGVPLEPGDRRALYVACVASFLMYLVFINTTQRTSALTSLPLLKLGIPFEVARQVYLALLVIGVASAAIFLKRMFARATPRVLLPSLLLLATQFTWFAVAAGIPFFGPDLSLGWVTIDSLLPAIAFLHCAQYLGVTAYYAKREHDPARGAFRFGRYFAMVVLGGVFLWLGTARLLSQVLSVDYNLSFLIMLSLINLHHFVMDGAIWKLRDGRIARLLITPEAAAVRAAERPATAKAPTPAPAPEIRPRPWRAVAWAVAIVLALGLATTDVLYRVLVLNAGELARAGKLAEARGLYETVLRFNPASVEAIDGLAYDAMAAGDTRVALERWERSIRLNPTSAYARVGIGQTYLQLGRVDDAIAHLERAIVLAPDQPSGFLLLANAYAKKGDREKAEAMRARASRAGSGGAAPATRIGY